MYFYEQKKYFFVDTFHLSWQTDKMTYRHEATTTDSHVIHLL